jgi:predicted DsbA family dithiol-disulfide isomerase
MSSPAAPIRLRVEIWSDVMCPWCAIGYYQLRKALDLLDEEIAAETIWHPFELNPGMPPEGEDMAEHILRKYGRAPDAAGSARILEMAQEAGYDMRWQGEGAPPPRRLWNTRRAHVLLQLALARQGWEGQTRLKLALFDAHFQQHRNIHDSDVLFEIAETCGIDRADAAQALSSPDLETAIAAEEAGAAELGITGVPLMLIEGRFTIPGAQNAEVYVTALRKMAERVRRERDDPGG